MLIEWQTLMWSYDHIYGEMDVVKDELEDILYT